MAIDIPRVFHQVWVGSSPFPDRFAAFQETWRRHHPDWELRFWTDDNLPDDLVRQEVYDRLRSPVERCDILRLELLRRDGGVYVDADFESLKPIDGLLEGIDFFVAYIGPGRPAHGLMGATPRHPVIERALREIRPVSTHGYDKAATGPPFFNRILADYPGLRIFPSELFYPSSDEERSQSAYADHHAERSWQDATELRRTIEKLQARLEKSEAKRKKLEAALADSRSRAGLARRLGRALGR